MCIRDSPQTVFQTLMRKYETERAEKATAIPELEQKVRAQLENRQDANRWMEMCIRDRGYIDKKIRCSKSTGF